MDLQFTAEDEEFRQEVRSWLAENLRGDFAGLVGTGGPGREHENYEARRAWERRLGEAGWIGLGWPAEHGGRGASLARQVIFHEEYARAEAPSRVSHMGENLLAPTLIHFGSAEQCRRFLPGIRRGEEMWCQGYSEPNAGSDLAAVQTRAVLDGDQWMISGQKVWTSLAQYADWCFVLARTEAGAPRHQGLSYLLVPMRQPGVEIRPINQLTGTSEFNEVFFDRAVTAAGNIVGDPGDGWRIALGTLAFERGVATLGRQIGYLREFERIVEIARTTRAIADPALHDRILDMWIDLQVMRYTALRTLSAASGAPGVGAGSSPQGRHLGGGGEMSGAHPSVAKLLWGTCHQRLGELAMDVAGPAAGLLRAEPYELSDVQRLFLSSRADTIYGGSNEIQRNIIAERMLGLPRERG